MSNWGTYPLRRELFIEEFEFILENLHVCIQIEVSGSSSSRRRRGGMMFVWYCFVVGS